MSIKNKRKAQSTAEYAILFGIIIGAVVAMQTYIKRGLQARVKDSTDVMTGVSGDPAATGKAIGKRNQFEPYYYSEEGYSKESQRTQGSTKQETLGTGESRSVDETMNAGVKADEKENSYIVTEDWETGSKQR